MQDRIQECLLKRPHKRSPVDIKDLAQHLSDFPCFMRGMHPAGIEALCRRMSLLRVPAMGIVLRQGAIGDCMFMVYKGFCHIYSRYGSVERQADLDIDDCGAFIGTKSQGGVLGEHSLISADSVHAYTAKAGETGADLLCIDRATFWHFADLGRTGVSEIPAQVASALRVACCQSILEMAPPDRSESDVQLLVEFLRGLQAFSDLSDAMMKKICKGITIEQYPTNHLVCEEDEPGDSMFIVLSGRCNVRALPPPEKSVDLVPPDMAIPPQCPPPGAPGTVKSVRRVKVAATDKVLKPNSLAGHSRALALQTLASVDDNTGRNTTTVHDSSYWVQKFMHAAFHDQDPETIGHGNDITPLAIVAAARWRKTLADVQREEAHRKAEAERLVAEQEKELKSRTEGMAGLIGKAAALHWKKATFGEIDSEKKSSVDWRQESMRIREKRLQEEHDQSDAQQLEASEDPPVDQVEEETDSVQGGFQHTSADMSVRLYNPNKQRLAQLGKLAPSNVSNNLRRELAQRSRLESILRSMEKMIQRQGPARRLGKTDSRKITRALNRSMLKGASRQVGRMRVPRLSKAANSFKTKQNQSEIGTETNTHVGADTDDWKSSLDCSDRESLVTDDRSMMQTDRSQVSTGGESFEHDDGAWRHVQWGCNGVPSNSRPRASTQSIIAVPSIAELEYGPVIRTLSPGETFGELALLQPQCLRTATVIATLSHNEEGSGPATDSLQGSRQSDDEFSSNSARERVSLIKVTRQLFDESVTSMQVFQSLQRDRLTALAVFFRQEHVPAGRVLATQGTEADRVFLIQEGEVAYVLEGDVAGNPMKPKPGLGTTIPGLPYLSQGSVSGMRMAMEKSSTRDIQNIDSRFLMHQLSEKIRSQEQAELESEGKEAVEHESAQLAQSTVAKHWGGKQRKSRARIAALIGDEADAAAEQYQHRHVQGLKLLVVGSSEMVGELSLGIKQPEQDEVEDPADAARKLVDSVRQRRLGHQSSSKRKSDHADRSNFNNMKKVDYVDTDQEVKSAVYPASLVTEKTCTLLSIATTDLLRFGSGVKEAMQTAAWSRHTALRDMQNRLTEANEELNIAVSSVRSLPDVSAEDTRSQAMQPRAGATSVSAPAQTAQEPRPSWAVLPGEHAIHEDLRVKPLTRSLHPADVGDKKPTGARATWMPMGRGPSFGLAGAHIQRTLSGQRSLAGGG